MNGSTAYQSGFGNEFATEALPGALPAHQNSPQRAPYGLYAEQVSGTAFTAPRSHNRRSWLYRIRPAAMHGQFMQIDNKRLVGRFDDVPTPPSQLRWDPLPMPEEPTDFVDSLVTMAGNGSPESQSGCAIHLYAANQSMVDRFFYNADGELLIVPQAGRLQLFTELGLIEIEPQEIAVIPRGIRFQVRCRSIAIRRSKWRMACMRSSCPAPPSPRRAATTGARGCTGSGRQPCMAASCRWMHLVWSAVSTMPRRRISCAGARCRCRRPQPISSIAG